jgi:hypothetical protein
VEEENNQVENENNQVENENNQVKNENIQVENEDNQVENDPSIHKCFTHKKMFTSLDTFNQFDYTICIL